MWLADLNREMVEVHRHPEADRYRSLIVVRPGEQLNVAGVTVDVGELLGS